MNIRHVNEQVIYDAVYEAIKHITYHPDPAVEPLLRDALDNECDEMRQDVLCSLINNIELSPDSSTPLCQDTGTLVVFAKIGNRCVIDGKPLETIINYALRMASSDLYLRASIVRDPLFNRTNTLDNSPSIVHTRIVEGCKIILKIAQKGGGAENMSNLRMMLPTCNRQDIIDFILETVVEAGAKACPPLVLGIGIGGNYEQCALLAKEALLSPIGTRSSNSDYAQFEQDILMQVNNTGVGAQGMGGNLTALDVHILHAPCHIASLPVAVNIQCHAHRHIELEI